MAGARLVTLAICLFVLSGILLRAQVLRATALSTAAYSKLIDQDIAGACQDMPQTLAAWDNAAILSRTLGPILHHLGWIPTIGGDLRVLPEVVTLARAGSGAAASVCSVVEPALRAKSAPERLALVAEGLRTHPDIIAHVSARLDTAETAWIGLAPFVDTSPRLAAYREQLGRLGAALPQMREGMTALEQLGPHLPRLLGLDEKQRYLLALQNPFELRPTGGFIGMVCVLQVENARMSLDSCKSSDAYDAPASDPNAMPSPYVRYLRLGGYFLRDANWSPDFPTTAKRLETFWALNGQPPVDGVIAADLYALVPIMDAVGPLTLDTGATVGAAEIVDVILESYYDTEFRDKAGMAKLLAIVIERVAGADLAALPKLVTAFQTATSEQHVLLASHQPQLQKLFAGLDWDGGVGAFTGDSLMIVDADVGYGRVNAFIERLTDYEVNLNLRGTPLTSTLTMTYTNRYSPWAEWAGPHSVWGDCVILETGMLSAHTGCYATYVRIYVPRGSTLIDAQGFDEAYAPDERYERTVLGGYVRVDPGEQRTLRLQYQLPTVEPGTLIIEKQPGTVAMPISVRVRQGKQESRVWASGRTDLRLHLMGTAEQLAVEGPTDPEAARAFAASGAFNTGLQQWQQGKKQEAVHLWQAEDVVDRALDHIQWLAERGSSDEALRLAAELTPIDPSGRAAFEQATLLKAKGDFEGAATLYEAAAARSPDHPLARLTWLEYLVASAQSGPVLDASLVSSSTLRRWRESIEALEAEGRYRDALVRLDILLRMAPSDRGGALRRADLLLKVDERQTAMEAYGALASEEDSWGLLAGAHHAELENDSDAARSRYLAAHELAETYEVAFRAGTGLRGLGDTQNAMRAFERARELRPTSAHPLLAIGDILRPTDPAGARQQYELARQVDPQSAFPDIAVARLLLDQGDIAAARELLEIAQTKEPGIEEVRVERERANQLDKLAGEASP